MELVARDGQYMPAKQARKTFALLAPHLAKKRKWSSDVWRIHFGNVFEDNHYVG